MRPQASLRRFGDLRIQDVPLVGGKNASLGELYSVLSTQGVRVPNGFALTAQSYRDALTSAGAWQDLHRILDPIDKTRIKDLAKRAAQARAVVYKATGTAAIRQQIADGYRGLEDEYGRSPAVAVRSSATAEDLPTASFAGQHDSFLNVRGVDAVFEACRRCFASIFTDRAISYRIDNGFDHFKVALSVGVMKMVRADAASSGVIFTLDTESGFRDVVFVTAVYGLGENIVQGTVDPDEFYVHKPTFRKGHRAVLSRSLGRKQLRMVYASGKSSTKGGTKNVQVQAAKRAAFCISDAEVLQLADYAVKIEDHYSAQAGHPMPMDIEWAKDADDGELYVIQARPETVASRRTSTALETHSLKGQSRVLATGRAVGEKIAAGKTRIVTDARSLAAFQPGEVLVADSTSPDWEPVMKTAAGIVTERGGRTCHAAIVARELGVPAVVGAAGAKRALKTGALVTVCCAEGDIGRVYEGRLPFEVMLNLGNPELAFRTAMLPNDGVGLARM
jgi:pyruvate,water dikinase